MVTYSALYAYLVKTGALKRADFKLLIKDAGIRLRDTGTRWYPKFQNFSMGSVEKILSLHYQQRGAREIRKRQRAFKAQKFGMSSEPKSPAPSLGP